MKNDGSSKRYYQRKVASKSPSAVSSSRSETHSSPTSDSDYQGDVSGDTIMLSGSPTDTIILPGNSADQDIDLNL